MTNKYGEIKKISDLIRVSNMIRRDVSHAHTLSALSLLHKRQAYLVTLTHSPTFKSNFNGSVVNLRMTAKTQYSKTSKLINKKVKSMGLDHKFDENWGTKG